MARLIIDFYGGVFHALEVSDSEPDAVWTFARTANLNDIIHRARDAGYKKIVFLVCAAEQPVTNYGCWPGSYCSAAQYTRNSLRGVDILPRV